MLNRVFVIVFVVAQLICVRTQAALDPSASAEDGKPLFGDHDVLELSLTVNFDSLCRPNEVENCQYTATTLVYRGADKVDHNIPVEIRVRGGWRARKDHCQVPPLFIRFPGEGTAATPFVGQGLLPLTTHCRTTKSLEIGSVSSREYEQYVFKEYLGYRLYNAVSDKSLRVRLARITYQNPGKKGKLITRHAFFTEHFDDMAVRHMAKRQSSKSFDHKRIDLPTFDQIALFSFMIGNTDWSVVRERNIVLIATEDGRQYPVPYDLDMSGLVNAEYAGVSPRLNFRDVRRRYYLGFCHPQADFEELFAQFEAHKNEMLALAEDVPGMGRSARKKSLAYLKNFFAVIESPKRRDKAITGACHPWPPAPQDHTTPPDAR